MVSTGAGKCAEFVPGNADDSLGVFRDIRLAYFKNVVLISSFLGFGSWGITSAAALSTCWPWCFRFACWCFCSRLPWTALRVAIGQAPYFIALTLDLNFSVDLASRWDSLHP